MRFSSYKPENPTHSDDASASFGFARVDKSQKQGMVRGVFDNVAAKYDLMNDAMSFGMHRLWKDAFVRNLHHLNADSVLLDVAGGTGDIALRLHRATGAPVTVLDINEAMLREGRARQFDKGDRTPLRYVTGNAQCLPIPDNSCDLYTIAFGLRNVTEIPVALKEACRVLKPGGQFRCLEFSPVNTPGIKQMYDAYSFHIIPHVGQLLAGDKAAYQYLSESIRMFPKAPQLVRLMRDAGFDKAEYKHMTFGVVAIHTGWKF